MNNNLDLKYIVRIVIAGIHTDFIEGIFNKQDAKICLLKQCKKFRDKYNIKTKSFVDFYNENEELQPLSFMILCLNNNAPEETVINLNSTKIKSSLIHNKMINDPLIVELSKEPDSIELYKAVMGYSQVDERHYDFYGNFLFNEISNGSYTLCTNFAELEDI